MTSRILLSAVIQGSVARRNRRDDGRLFAVATVRDFDRLEPRTWTVFVNDLAINERLEAVKDGEPVAIAGPFSVTADGDRLTYRVTCDAIIGVRKQRKKRGPSPETPAVDPDDAPKEGDAGRPFNDDLPF